MEYWKRAILESWDHSFGALMGGVWYALIAIVIFVVAAIICHIWRGEKHSGSYIRDGICGALAVSVVSIVIFTLYLFLIAPSQIFLSQNREIMILQKSLDSEKKKSSAVPTINVNESDPIARRELQELKKLVDEMRADQKVGENNKNEQLNIISNQLKKIDEGLAGRGELSEDEKNSINNISIPLTSYGQKLDINQALAELSVGRLHANVTEKEADKANKRMILVANAISDYAVKTFSVLLSEVAKKENDTVVTQYEGAYRGEPMFSEEVVWPGFSIRLKNNPSWNFRIDHIYSGFELCSVVIREEMRSVGFCVPISYGGDKFEASMYSGGRNIIFDTFLVKEYQNEINRILNLFVVDKLQATSDLPEVNNKTKAQSGAAMP